MSRHLRLSLLSLVCLSLSLLMAAQDAEIIPGPPPDAASPITYTFAGTASGNLGGRTFTNEAFAIAVGSNTNSIEDCGGSLLNNDSIAATISISGFNVATFITPTAVFDYQSHSTLGFFQSWLQSWNGFVSF